MAIARSCRTCGRDISGSPATVKYCGEHRPIPHRIAELRVLPTLAPPPEPSTKGPLLEILRSLPDAPPRAVVDPQVARHLALEAGRDEYERRMRYSAAMNGGAGIMASRFTEPTPDDED